MNNILEGDCLELMKDVKKDSIDCIVTDPPFFMPTSHYQSRIKWQRKYTDLNPLKVFWTEITKELVRILKPTGHLFVFCNRDHPVEKPVELIKELIEPTTFEGDVIFDPFLGGGSTCLAAQQLKRNYFGMELDHDYFEIASNKLKNNQKTLV